MGCRRIPPRTARDELRALKHEEHIAMPHRTAAMSHTRLASMLGKDTRMIGLDDRAQSFCGKGRSRPDRSPVANVSQCLIGIEAGMATHYVARELSALGHDAKQSTARLCQAVPARPEERLQRCRRDRGGGAATVHAVRRDEDRRSAGSAGTAPGAISPGRPTHSRDQSDRAASCSSTALRYVKDYGFAAPTLRHPGQAQRRICRLV